MSSDEPQDALPSPANYLEQNWVPLHLGVQHLGVQVAALLHQLQEVTARSQPLLQAAHARRRPRWIEDPLEISTGSEDSLEISTGSSEVPLKTSQVWRIAISSQGNTEDGYADLALLDDPTTYHAGWGDRLLALQDAIRSVAVPSTVQQRGLELLKQYTEAAAQTAARPQRSATPERRARRKQRQASQRRNRR